MSSPFGPLVLIANPHAGRGEVGRNLPEVERRIASMGLEHRVVRTRAEGDATRAAREALQRGESYLVAVGGDGTINEVVNGMLEDDAPLNRDAVLGVVAAGSGADFPATFGLPGDVALACRYLEGDNLFPIDVGKVTTRSPDGGSNFRYFPNVSAAGRGAEAVARAGRLPERLGRSRDLLGFWLALARFRPASLSLRGPDGAPVFEGEAHELVVANGQYHRGGMRISPRSWPGDGLLEVLVMTGPRSDAFTLLPKIYRGEHLPHPDIVELKAREVEVVTGRPWPVQADGRSLGLTPAMFELVRLPIRLKV